MRITILAYGSRGDVQPHLALGCGLMHAGYQVRIAAPERFASLAVEHGLEFSPLAGDPSELSLAFVDHAGTNPIKEVQVMAEYVNPLAQQVWRDIQSACRDCDAIIHSFMMMLSGHIMAEKLGVPQVSTHLFPAFFPTKEFHVPAVPKVNNSIYNWMSHYAFRWAFWNGGRFANNYLVRCKGADLPPVKVWPLGKDVQPPIPVLYGISPSVLAKPADWPPQTHMTGYWYLDEREGWQPSPKLQQYLQAGPPPIYIGFGSMMTKNPKKLMEIITEAVQLSGKRAVLLSGWAGLDAGHLPQQLFVTHDIPHSWLFPRMAAIVHHGGAGTTAAAFRSGKPQVVVPFTADQPFWAERVRCSGVGTKPLPYRKLTAEKLAAAITQAVEDPAIHARAKELGNVIHRENGVDNAVKIIRMHFGNA
jgi:sterol 3beta-glucosyltransferase